MDVQCAAGLLSALALTAANLAVYGGLFVAQGPLALADTPLYSFVTSRFVWFDGTYGQYLLVLVALVAALGMACGALSLFLSRYSSTYVVMLLKATPLFVGAGALFGSWLLDRTFYFREVFWGAGVLVPRFAEVACVAVLLLAVLLLWHLVMPPHPQAGTAGVAACLPRHARKGKRRFVEGSGAFSSTPSPWPRAPRPAWRWLSRWRGGCPRG